MDRVSIQGNNGWDCASYIKVRKKIVVCMDVLILPHEGGFAGAFARSRIIRTHERLLSTLYVIERESYNIFPCRFSFFVSNVFTHGFDVNHNYAHSICLPRSSHPSRLLPSFLVTLTEVYCFKIVPPGPQRHEDNRNR